MVKTLAILTALGMIGIACALQTLPTVSRLANGVAGIVVVAAVITLREK